jgi:hypothetical protein
LKKHRGKSLILSMTVLAAVSAAVYFGRLPLAGSTHRINPYTCMKLRVGMPQDKVEAIFRTPPGDYSSEPGMNLVEGRGDARLGLELRREDWTSDEGGAVVYFGPDGRVADFTLWVTPGRTMTAHERIRKWLYWLTVW